MFFDTHCHIHMKRFEGEDAALIERMRQARVMRAVVVATDVDEIAQVQALLDRYPELYGAFALSPQDEELVDLTPETIAQHVSGDRWVAVGETGIDYHYCEEPLDWARNRFATHIAAARLAKKPLIIHSREAADDTIAILRENGAEETGFVLHCFCGDWDFARRALDMGAYLSFSGIVTFKNALDQQDVARRAPMDRILIETDSPYLAPIPLRGKRNEPSYVPHVANFLADLRGMTIEEVAQETTANAMRFFKLKE
jgi:TatD DNase family protein